MPVPCLWACRGQQGRGCTISQGHTVFHELSRTTVFEQKKTHTHVRSFLEQIPEQRVNGVGATKASTPRRASLGCRAPQAAQAAATLLDTSFWLERSWPVPTKKDSIPRSRIVTLPCGHIALCRQEAPVPCFYRESAFPGLSAPSCTLAWLSKRTKTSSAP